MQWLLWALLLVVQQASHTLSSRSRNSASYGYHAAAAVFSNGVWFVAQWMIVEVKFKAMSGHTALMVGTFIFYVVFTVAGSVGAHWFCRKIERGSMKVGA